MQALAAPALFSSNNIHAQQHQMHLHSFINCVIYDTLHLCRSLLPQAALLCGSSIALGHWCSVTVASDAPVQLCTLC